MEGHQPGQTSAPQSKYRPTADRISPNSPYGSDGTQADYRDPSEVVTWTASEFVEHKKSASWYGALALATVIVAGLIFLITRDKISTSVIVVAAIVLGYMAARKPRTLEYRLNEAGLMVGAKFYGYEQFKSFSVIDEGAIPSIYLLPMKRFMPSLTIYYAPADEEKIVNVLTGRLPIEERRVDTMDRFLHRIRF